ncbi:hypothetical protein K2173_011351 [Erythroxylum novogranatense]|uniref:BHLH domain-containing protein n=1 Tax=Erythroxylum novogranatense TaxID=1862640 RepID=A0AAV8S9H1_9ROSI|nr:hypothetical protein K2173_011351 [Erythroxylum novogranatense]
MSLSYGHTFMYSEGELRKNQDFMDFNHHNYHQQEHNSGLTSYRSAPSSFLDNLVNGHGSRGNGVGCEDLSYFRSLSPEMDALFSRFTPQTQTKGAASGDSHFHDLKEFGDRPAIKREITDSRMVGHSVTACTGNSLASSFASLNSPSLDHPMQMTKMNTGLHRQNSSPPGMLSNLSVDNGIGVSYRACNGTNGEASPSTSRLSNHINLPSRSRLLHQISAVEGESFVASKDTKTHFISNFTRDYWDDNSMGVIKTVRDNDETLFSCLNTSDHQVKVLYPIKIAIVPHQDKVHPIKVAIVPFCDKYDHISLQAGISGNGLTLTHHLSLPKTSAVMEKFLHFKGSVPCKIRAKRGCATHPRSIAERVRRTRISERMRKLQGLFPDMDKQINTADMLDVAVEYIKDLQKQVKTLTDTRAKCTCSRKQKPCSSPT